MAKQRRKKKTSNKRKGPVKETQQELVFDENGKVQEPEEEAPVSPAPVSDAPDTDEPQVSEPAEPTEPAVSDTPEAVSDNTEKEGSESSDTLQDTGEAVISPEDYQPIIWLYPEQQNAESSAEETEASEKETSDNEAADQEIHKEPAEAEGSPDGGPEIEIDETPSSPAARICGILFAAVLVLVFIVNIIMPDKSYSDQENRVFQQLPSFSAGNYLSGRFESQLDNYASDQFAFRDTFIKIKSAADLSIGQLKANGVFKAKDNYLIEDVVYPDKKGVEADLAALKRFKEKYSDKKMYFMLVPNAANILSSKLPGGVVTRDQNKDMDRLFGAVEALGYKAIDVRDDLKKASRKQQVYYRTDHHWTTDGAYTAYRRAAEIMKLNSNVKYKPYVVKKDFAGTLYSKSGYTNGKNDAIKIYLPDSKDALNSVIRYKDTKEKTTKYYVMSNLDKKDAYTVFGGINQSLFSISTPVKKNRNLLVIKDSYANCFIPFLTQDYRTITVVDPRYYYENIATVIKANDIDEVLFLYNSNTFFSDNYMRMMLTNR